MNTRVLISALLLTTATAAAQAQNRSITARSATTSCTAQAAPGGAPRQPTAEEQQYDVVLDVPALCVDRIHLRVKNLDAHVALNALVANLVSVQAGADVNIRAVDLTIQGVEVSAQLLVDLDNVRLVADSVLTLIDNHPEIIEQVYRTTQNAVGTVGGLAQTALQPGGVISQTVNTLGQTLTRTVDATGHILERTIDTAGKLVNERTLGLVTSLPLVRETAGTAGSMVRVVRDASGALIEYTIDAAGKISNARVLSGTPQR